MTPPPSETVRDGLCALRPKLWRYALSLCRDAATADDLVQATCMRALERADQFQPGTHLDRWTFTILTSIWKNHLRAETQRRGHGLVEAVDHLTVDMRPQLEASLLTKKIAAALTQMPEVQRSAVLLVYVEGWSYKDAAAALEVPLGTLMSRLARARASLAQFRSGTH